jgi:chemotaxis protein MotB
MSKKHGHHGGAWKVAYADFVTAMMALFLCLWLTAQDEKIKEAVERAFRQPYAIGKEGPSSLLPKDGKETDKPNKKEQGPFQSASALEVAMLRRLSEDLAKTLEKQQGEDLTESVKLEFTPDGLRISVFDSVRRPIFEPDSIKMTTYGDWVFSTLAWEISRYTSLGIELEGHTERGHRPPGLDYGSWELSADRANAARRKLLNHGVQNSQVHKVGGFADTLPLPGQPPDDPINRRVAVLLKVNSSGQL